ncbi:MAG: HNH endonuclease [Alphaproteobacteria bacterium]|nr:HNH endonuclease [Alphaproteobacteria bacterium]MDA8003616.1 HNH endonuclease [Alphaproteobacteria bacterium]MDA8005496.1 HNH endonuclease [Alphaproteobacteria bacterium]MDA8013199.1 HNH endonuclease [Alphaproteobacteria bacterium]
MKIELAKITIRDLADGYEDNQEEGVSGYGGRLDIRPPYQREFVYKDKQRDAVIDTAARGFPLNVMYWAVREDGDFEVIDGQQRTISICQFVEGDFTVYNKDHEMRLGFANWQDEEQNKFLDYPLTVYLCEGTDREKLDWFRIVNIAGERLYDQELRNAVFSGPWVSDAKRYFSRTGCPAYGVGGKYLTGSPIRQDYLQTAIAWLSDNKIDEHMSASQHKPDAKELWGYFRDVIDWVERVFPNYRKEMKTPEWGTLYNLYKDADLDPQALEGRIKALMEDEDVSSKPGVYAYVLTGEERHLNLRSFGARTKREVYERQNGVCARCGKERGMEQMEADHIKPWSEGGKTDAENCQMLCKQCNREKSNK